MKVALLSGGVGGARFARALAETVDPADVTVIGNVGDDVEILGLHVSPDLDTVLYTLAGLLDEERGWGVRDETYGALGMADRLGADTWFTLGDRDIGLHLVRTELLRAGVPLSETFARLAAPLGVRARLLPVSDEAVRTIVSTPAGDFDFQTWFVRRQHRDEVLGVRYDGADEARPAPGVVQAIADADVVFLAPSNPFVSIGPILAVQGVADAVAARRGPVVAVSPLVGGRAIRGPLAGLMRSLGHEASALGIARLYVGLASHLVVDPADAALVRAIEQVGSTAIVTPVVMVAPEVRGEVGRAIIAAL